MTDVFVSTIVLCIGLLFFIFFGIPVLDSLSFDSVETNITCYIYNNENEIFETFERVDYYNISGTENYIRIEDDKYYFSQATVIKCFETVEERTDLDYE